MKHPFPTKKFLNANGEVVDAFRVTAGFAATCPKHGGPFVRHGEGIGFYTGRYIAREKEFAAARYGDYIVTYSETSPNSPYMDSVPGKLFESEFKELDPEPVDPEPLPEIEEVKEEVVIESKPLKIKKQENGK